MSRARRFLRTLKCGIVVATALAGAAREAGAQLRVLFIGNSYTYFNNAPEMVADLARGAQPSRAVRVEAVVRGGATLRDHWNAGAALQAIRRGRWDFVVLQEQSMLGVMLANGQPTVNNPAFFHKYARLFAGEITRARAKPVFYMTWSRKATPQLQDRLTRAYSSIAAETGGLLAPVGIAWQRVRTERPDLELYDPDGSHPSPTGSYLAATTILAAILGRVPERLPSVVRGRLLLDTGSGTQFSDSAGQLAVLPDSDAAFIHRSVRQALAQSRSTAGLQESAASPPDLPPLPQGLALTAATLVGQWSGRMRLYDNPADVLLTLSHGGNGLVGDWRVTGNGWSSSLPLREVRIEGTRLTFLVPDPRFLTPPERHRAVLAGDALQGHVEVGDVENVPRLLGSWRLIRASSR